MTIEKKSVSTPLVPIAEVARKSISSAIRVDDDLFISGQIALTKEGSLANTTLEIETRQVMDNVKAIVEAAGGSMDNLVKVNIYLSNFDDFETVNEIYTSYFEGMVPPARSTVEVSRLYQNLRVEIDAIARMGG